MQFPGFYGNNALRQRLSGALSRGGLSHCYLLTGPEGSGKKTLARILAAAMECTGGGDRPCGICPSCRKIFGAGHPDVITVDSDTATVPVRVIRDMAADAYIRPNEGAKKIYLLPRAQDMQAPAQNALLKLLEEPPEYCVFLLMADNAEKLLTTVRSRAVELTLFPLEDRELRNALSQLCPDADEAALAAAAEKSGGYLGQALTMAASPQDGEDQRAAALTEALISGDELQLLSVLVPLEKIKRQELLAVMEALYRITVRAMRAGKDSSGLYTKEALKLSRALSPQQLYSLTEAIQTVISMLQANGSPGHCVGYLLTAVTA